MFIEEGEISWNADNAQGGWLIGTNNIRINKRSSAMILLEYFKSFRNYSYKKKKMVLGINTQN